ncbi:MAG: hypothetical protein AAFW89_10310 [Bacteroidota bacterium]
MGILLISILSCSGQKELLDKLTELESDTTGAVDKPGVTDPAPRSDEERIEVTYGNKSTGLTMKLNPDKDRFFMELRGVRAEQTDTVIVADSTLMRQRNEDMQRMLASFREAQDLLYLNELDQAVAKINEVLDIQETADAYALKGTIYFLKGNRTAARANWNRAVQINPNLPIPSIEGLDAIIQELLEENQQ